MDKKSKTLSRLAAVGGKVGVKYLDKLSQYNKQHNMETIQTCWIKYECEHGARWTVAKNLIGGKIKSFGKCNFSGCKEGHTFSKVGETSDLNEARNWFNNPYA